MEKIGLELIYKYVNGELQKNSELSELIVQKIQDQDPLKEWDGTGTSTGYFHYSVYVINGIDGLIIDAQWVPAPNYSWEERRIYILRL